jgi:hypothetical protein
VQELELIFESADAAAMAARQHMQGQEPKA